MIDGKAVVLQVREGKAPADWQVWRAKRSYFLGWIAMGGIWLTLSSVLLLVLLAHPDQAVVPLGVQSLDASGLRDWRTLDFIFVAVCILVLVAAVGKQVIELLRVESQMVVLLPDGFVIARSEPISVAFADIVPLIPATNARGTITLTVLRGSPPSPPVRLHVDERFGGAGQRAQIAQQLTEAALR